MRPALVLSAVALVAIVVLAGSLAPTADASIGPIPPNCDRACLEDVIDQYLMNSPWGGLGGN